MSTLTTTTTIPTPANPLTKAPSTSALNTDILCDGKPKRLHHIPTFATKIEEQKWQKEQMAAGFRLFAKMGFADGASGHISLRGTFALIFTRRGDWTSIAFNAIHRGDRMRTRPVYLSLHEKFYAPF